MQDTTFNIPPEQRLCRIHNIPISPARWKSGHRHTDCARCRNKHESKKRNTRQRHYNDAMVNRGRLTGRIYGLELFERSTGMELPRIA